MKKNLFYLFMVLSIIGNAQTIFPLPYSQNFSSTVDMAEWTKNFPWVIDTTAHQASAEVSQPPVNNVQMYSPWLDVTTVINPMLRFEVRINKGSDDCYPVFVLARKTPMENFVTIGDYGLDNPLCAEARIILNNNQWTEVAVSLEPLAQVKYIFQAEFEGAGKIEIRNIRFDAESVLNVSKITASHISIFPNPNNGTFSLGSAEASKKVAQVNIVDVFGRVVYKEYFDGRASNQISTLLEAGSYILQMQLGNVITEQRLFITK